MEGFDRHWFAKSTYNIKKKKLYHGFDFISFDMQVEQGGKIMRERTSWCWHGVPLKDKIAQLFFLQEK